MHPAQRFRAPMAITAGTPLKSLMGRALIGLIGESLQPVVPGFDRAAFARDAARGLDALALMPRAQAIGAAMARHLAPDPAAAAAQLVAGLGPPLPATSGNGLRPFFYLPHSACVAAHLRRDWEAGMGACLELTRRFTAEFAIRPYIIADQPRAIDRLAAWAGHPDAHVRRLVSEGARPRLPWACRLPALQRDPSPMLPLLTRLVDDPSEYVRRSVANHVGDIAKDHPRIAFDLCRAWLRAPGEHRRAAVRHALRLPARRGVAAALALRTMAGGR